MSLYKYVTADRGIEILRKGLIRFTQPGVFNDPFECRPFLQSITDGFDASELSQISEPIKISAKKRKEAFARVEAKASEVERALGIRFPSDFPRQITEALIDFLSENPLKQMLEQHDSVATLQNILLPNFSSQIGILSLAERPDNLLMWSHYSGQHTGFVLEFDEEHPFFKTTSSGANDKSPMTLSKVRYSIGRPERPSINLKDFLAFSGWYLVKSEEWKYEREWRMIRPLAIADVCLQLQDTSDKKGRKTQKYIRVRERKYEETLRMMRFVADAMKPEEGRFIYLFSLPPECIKSVIIGCRTPNKHRRKILGLLSRDKRYSHVGVCAAITDEKNFQINIAPL